MKCPTLAGIALAIVVALPVAAQQPGVLPPLSQKLSVSPDIKVGTLPNGIRYYIVKNSEPAKRAELRLVVNAGAILEDADQQGYAHFLEHTAFNGTTHFKENELMKYLESNGVRFGYDLNASTSFDQTIYQLSIPSDSVRLFERAFVILEDWAHGQLFDSTEVVNERGVILEEWRGRLGAGERMQRQFIPIILKGSKYADRNVIGSEESINKALPAPLKRFYQDWYRPDLMAVIAVGDFDPARVEGLIKQHFSAIPMPRNPRPRPNIAVPGNEKPLIAIVSDPEATSSSLTIGYKRPRPVVATVGDFRNRLAERLYFAMLNSRLSEIGQKPDAPFLGASASMSGFFARDLAALTFNAGVKDGGVERGAEAVLLEARRANEFGFLPSELQRAKDNVQRGYERSYNERAKTSSAARVGELIGNFLEQEDIAGIETEYNLARQLLPGITVAELNTMGRSWITDANRIALVTVPQKAGVSVPTEAQLLAVFDRVSRTPVTAYTENMTDAPLFDRVPTRGRVVATRVIDAGGANVTEWKLSNGARVLVKPTDFKADEVLFSAYSPGGTSLVSDADYVSAANATTIVRASGIGRFNLIDMGKKLAGKVANANAAIGATSETLGGNASPKDIETMFQLINLRFTAPRLDTAAWLSMKAAFESQVANRSANPQSAFSDTITAIMSGHHYRYRPPTVAMLGEINTNRAFEIYRDRFSNAGDFTFVFVGNVVLDSLKPLVETYVASLPLTGRVETWKDVGDAPPKGIVEAVVRKGAAPQAATQILFTGPFTSNPQSRLEMLVLTTLGQMWLTETLREGMGGTYSPSITGGGSRIPRAEYRIGIGYASSPDNVDKLWARTQRVIDSLKTIGPSEADLAKVKEQIARERETSIKQNLYWLTNISGRDQNNEDIGGLLGPYDTMLKNLTTTQVRDAANRYLDMKRYVKVVLLPEK